MQHILCVFCCSYDHIIVTSSPYILALFDSISICYVQMCKLMAVFGSDNEKQKHLSKLWIRIIKSSLSNFQHTASLGSELKHVILYLYCPGGGEEWSVEGVNNAVLQPT